MSPEQISGLGVSLMFYTALAWLMWIARPPAPPRHTRTDPACALYTPPQTRLGVRLHDQARGRSCHACLASRGVA